MHGLLLLILLLPLFFDDAEQSNACKVKALLITQVGFAKTRSKYKNYQLNDHSQSHFGPGLEVGVAVRAGCVHEPAAAGPDCFNGGSCTCTTKPKGLA